MNITLDIQDRKNYYLIRVNGKFVTPGVREVQNAAERAIKMNRNVLLFDMEKTELIDSNGIGLIINLQKELSAKGGKICLASPSPKILTILKLSSLQKIISIYRNVEEAELAMGSSKLYKEDRGFYIFIRLPREFNLDIVKPLRETVNEAFKRGYENIVFSLEETELMTSVGIGTLINLQKKLQEKGGNIHLIGISTKIRPLLEATNVLQVIPEYKTVDEIEEKLL